MQTQQNKPSKQKKSNHLLEKPEKKLIHIWKPVYGGFLLSGLSIGSSYAARTSKRNLMSQVLWFLNSFPFRSSSLRVLCNWFFGYCWTRATRAGAGMRGTFNHQTRTQAASSVSALASWEHSKPTEAHAAWTWGSTTGLPACPAFCRHRPQPPSTRKMRSFEILPGNAANSTLAHWNLSKLSGGWWDEDRIYQSRHEGYEFKIWKVIFIFVRLTQQPTLPFLTRGF